MDLLFKVTNQRLKRDNTLFVVADSENYLGAKFTFSNDWNGFTKTAIFTHNNVDYEVILVNDECEVPWEVINAYYFSVSVMGIKDDVLITTNDVNVLVKPSNYVPGETPGEPTPTVYQYLVNIESTRDAAESSRTSAEESRVDAEIERAQEEADRVSAEVIRVSAENGRISAESLRNSAEASRVSAESSRASVESLRVSAENSRQQNETTRVTNENARVQSFNTMQQTNEAYKTNLDNRFSSLQSSINQSNEDFKSDVEITVNSFDGRVSKLEDETEFPVTNDIVNGDFRNGTNGWSAYGTNLAIVDGMAKLTSTNITSSIRMSTIHPELLVNNKYYVKALIRPTRVLPSAIQMMFYGTGVSPNVASTVIPPYTLNDDYLLSGVYTNTVQGANQFQLVFFYGADTNMLDVEAYAGYFISINLTEVFGAGNEPTKEQMDALLSFYPNAYFEGTVNLADNRKFVPFLFKEFKNRAINNYKKWSTVTLINGWESVDGFETLQYNIDGFGCVVLRGLIRGQRGTICAYLPVEARPPKKVYATGNNAGTSSVIVEVATNGAILAKGSGNETISFENIRYEV